MCCRDRGAAALVTRGDEEAALLGWCYTLVLLLARGIKGECARTRAHSLNELRRHPGRGHAW